MATLRITPRPRDNRDITSPEVQNEIWRAAEEAARQEIRRNARRASGRRTKVA